MGVMTLYVDERRPGMHVPLTRLAMPVVKSSVNVRSLPASSGVLSPKRSISLSGDDMPVEARFRSSGETGQPGLV